MKISVACCVYNGERFLDAQLQSLIAQDRRPDEIVIVDDRSSDDSLRIAERFRDSAPAGTTVIVERNAENRGVVANFQKAIAMTTGEIVFLCDQDDVWHATKVETMLAEFERRPSLLFLFSDARLVDAAGRPLQHTLFAALEVSAYERRLVRERRGMSAWLIRNLATGAASAFRRSVFTAASPFPSEWVHDEWLAIIASALGDVDYIDETLIDYRQHDANQIGMRKLTLPEKFRRLFRPRRDYFRKMRRRTDILADKLRRLGDRVPPAHLAAIDAKRAHVEVRASLPARRVARVAPILREIATGRYRTYSSGLQSIVRDLLEPD